MKIKVILLIAVVWVGVCFWEAPVQSGADLPPLDHVSIPKALDYAQPKSWLALPANPNRFDVDVFWVYPTVITDRTDWIVTPSSPSHRQGAHLTLVSQASVFDRQTNIYSPLYRQMSIDGLSLPTPKRDMLLQYGEDDVWRAFEYYLAHYNKGKPFILAGHSQGSDLLVRLLLKKWGKKGADQRMVAAYLIGWSITRQELQEHPGLKMCNSASQTGCLVSYNCVAAGRQNVAPTILPGAVVVNPLSWTIDDELVSAERNLGAVFVSSDGSKTVRPHFTSAMAVDGGLVVVPADPALLATPTKAFPKGVYHMFDYALFYENIKENASVRINAFKQK